MKKRDDGRQGERKISALDYCWGRNPVISLLAQNPARCTKVLVAKTAKGSPASRIADLCRASRIPCVMVEMKVLDAMTGGESHQGVVASLSPAPMISLDDAAGLLPGGAESAMAVIMDHVEDPRNMGAMIRSAEAAGAIFAAIPLRRGALPTGTVAKTSAGASLRLPLASLGNVANAVRVIKEAGLWAVGLSEKAPATIYDSPLPPRCLFVVGGEGGGMSRTAAGACDEILSIPMRGGAGSLNASVALSIGMFEWLRMHRTSNQRSENDERKGDKK